MLRLSDFVTCRKRYYNQSVGGSISQLWKTVGRLKFRTYLFLTVRKSFYVVTVE